MCCNHSLVRRGQVLLDLDAVDGRDDELSQMIHDRETERVVVARAGKVPFIPHSRTAIAFRIEMLSEGFRLGMELDPIDKVRVRNPKQTWIQVTSCRTMSDSSIDLDNKGNEVLFL